MTSFFTYADLIKHQFLVCKIPSNHVIKLMTSTIIIIWHVASWCMFSGCQVSTSCHFQSWDLQGVEHKTHTHTHTHCTQKMKFSIKGALSGLRQFLAIERTLKLMRNAFYFTSKALFVLKIFKIFVLIFWSCNKRFD